MSRTRASSSLNFNMNRLLTLSPVEQPELLRMILLRIPFGDRAIARHVNRKWNANTTYSAGEKLQWACQLGNLSIVNRLLQDDREDPSVNNNNAIRWASEFGHWKVVGRLQQDHRVDASAGSKSKIDRWDQWVSQFSEVDCLAVTDRLLRDARFDPSADDNHAITWACFTARISIVARLLKDPRVDPSVDDNFAIRIASEGGHLGVVGMLLMDPRVDPSADDNAAIVYACTEGHVAV